MDAFLALCTNSDALLLHFTPLVVFSFLCRTRSWLKSRRTGTRGSLRPCASTSTSATARGKGASISASPMSRRAVSVPFFLLLSFVCLCPASAALDARVNALYVGLLFTLPFTSPLIRSTSTRASHLRSRTNGLSGGLLGRNKATLLFLHCKRDSIKAVLFRTWSYSTRALRCLGAGWGQGAWEKPLV